MRTTVSVVLPVLNERTFIRDCLDSLLGQDYPAIAEVLIVDGGSTDGTLALLAGEPSHVRVLDNPRVTAAAALNVALAAAVGDVIVRADAHSIYEPDYVARCVAVLEESGAANVGGRMRPVGTTSFGRAVAAVTSSPLGIGPGRFHYSERREDVDTVYLGCWHRATLDAVGGWDEIGLQWGAEDQDLNYRIRRRGGRVLLDPSIRSWYFPRETPRSLWRQYFNYGVCKASALAKHRRLPSWRPLAPAAFVGASLASLLFGTGWRRFAGVALHLGVSAGAATRLGRDPGVAPHRALLALMTCHWSYGLGFWSGLWAWLSGRGFNSAPSGHR